MARKSSKKRLINDFYIDLVLDQINVHPILLSFGIGVLLFIVFWIIAYREGVLFSANGEFGYYQNFNLLNNFFIDIPIMLFIYVRLSERITDAFTGIKKNGLVKGPNKQFKRTRTQLFFRNIGEGQKNSPQNIDQFTEYIRKLFSDKKLYFASILVSAALVAAFIPYHLTSLDRLVKNDIGFIALELLWLITFAMGSLFCLRLILSITSLNFALRYFDLNLQPLAADGAAGLKPLSDFALDLGKLIAVAGMGFLTNHVLAIYLRTGNWTDWRWDWDLTVLWIIYFGLALLVTLPPLFAAHAAMRSWRDKRLDEISAEFNTGFNQRRNRYSKNLERLNLLADFSVHVARTSTWPFRTQQLAWMVVFLFLPFLISLVSGFIAQWLVVQLAT
jgi:hypothetical protein